MYRLRGVSISFEIDTMFVILGKCYCMYVTIKYVVNFIISLLMIYNLTTKLEFFYKKDLLRYELLHPRNSVIKKEVKSIKLYIVYFQLLYKYRYVYQVLKYFLIFFDKNI